MTVASSYRVAAVTGVRGMIGARVARLLREQGWLVRGLVRSLPDEMADGIEYMAGDLTDLSTLRVLFDGADAVFNCAGEVRNPSHMMQVNAEAVREMSEQAAQSGIRFFCQISSAGVTCPESRNWVDEQTPCYPENAYEMSKWKAEQYLLQLNAPHMRICMLRPTNVIDDDRPGVLAMALRNSWSDRIASFLKGGECAHLVHAADVAAAAIYLAGRKECEAAYIVGYDEDHRNTVSGVYGMVNNCLARRGGACPHLPVSVPYWMRRLVRGSSLHGRTRFSSKRLITTGFTFELGLQAAIERICSNWMKQKR